MKRGVDYIGVGIGAAIVDREGRIFLSQRGPAAQNERSKWELPGGALEFGESFERTVIREIQEEFGMTIKPVDWLAPFNHAIADERQHWVALCFVCIVVRGVPKILETDKSRKIGWFTLDQMKSLPLTLTAKHRLKQIKKKYPKGLPNLYI